MNYQGDITLNDTIDFKFTTVTADGVPATISGSPVVSAYVDNSITQITAGITLTVDFDGVVGLHNARVAATTGNGFATGTDIYLAVTTGTVDGISVAGYVVGSFSIQNRYVGGGGGATDWTDPERQQIRHRLGIDGTTAVPAATPSLAKPGDAMALTSGERTTFAGVLWNALTSALTTVGSIGKLLVDNINATISSRSTYVGADTAGTTTLLSRIGSALTIISGKVDVNDKTGFALAAAYDPAKTAMQAGPVTLTSAYDKAKTASQPGDIMTLTAAYDPSKTAAQAGSAMTLTAAYDAAKQAASQSSVNTVMTVTNRLDSALELDGAVYRYTVNALEQAPTGTGGGGDEVSDWTTTEKDQIRYRLGIDGNSNVPAAVPTLASKQTVDQVKAQTDKLIFEGSDVKATLDGEAVILTSAYDKAKTAAQAGDAMTLTSAYDAAKTAASQISVNGIKVTTDHLETTMELDGSVYRFTDNALEMAPVGGTLPPSPTPGSPCSQNPARTIGPTTEPLLQPLPLRSR